MKQTIKWISLIALLIPNLALADIAVIVNINNSTDILSPGDLRNIYRVRTSVFPDASAIILSYQPTEQEVTLQFFDLVVGQSMTQLNRYWATRIFSGRMQRPVKLRNDSLVIEWIARNRSGIGYIDDKNLRNTVKKVATIKVETMVAQ